MFLQVMIYHLSSFQKSGSIFVPLTVQSAQTWSYVIITQGIGERNICWSNPPGPIIQAVGWIDPASIIQEDVLRYGIKSPLKIVSPMQLVYRSIKPEKRSFMKILLDDLAETLK